MTTTTAAALKVHALRTELDAIEANPLVDRAWFVPSQPSVFFGATLPRAGWIAHEDLDAGVDGDLQVLGRLPA